jgi:hypothetical protein
MLSEINNENIIGHIAGLTSFNKIDFINRLKKTSLYDKVNIIDLDNITNKIINDKNMGLLYFKYEEITELKEKINNNKIKEIEKKMNQYWKVKMEYYLIKELKNSNKPNLLIGFISYFKNHKINLNLDIPTKYFIKVDYDTHTQNIIESNLDENRTNIINGLFDLNFLDKNFLIKKRLLLSSIYKKLGYNILPINTIICSIEIFSQINIPDCLYFCSFIEYEKKINLPTDENNILTVYSEEWLALTAPQIDQDGNVYSLKKGIQNKVPYIYLSNNNIKELKKKVYLYEITLTDIFIPYPSKTAIYKYITSKPIKYNRIIEINNLIDKLNDIQIKIIKT